MGGESPVVELYDSNGNPLSVQNGSAIPASTPALMIAGTDGTNSRYFLVDSSGRPVMVGAGTAGSPAGGVVSIQGVASGTVVPISGTIGATQNGNIDAGNSSTVTLAGSGTFTGTSIDVSVYGVVTVFVFTDQAGTLNLEWSINGTNWDDVNSYAVSASTALSIQFGPQARFFRVVYQNGSTAQGTFRLQTIERPITAFPETVPASYTIANSDNVLLTKTVQGTSPWVENITQFGGNNVVTGTGASGVGIPRVTVSNDSNVLVTQSTSPWVDNITQFGGTNISTGTGAGGAGIPRVTVSNDSNILATQSGSWTVTANQGTPNTNANKWPVQVTDGTHNMPTMDAIARAGFQEITDGTNGPVAVKAASTAAAAADPSLVTAFSPNSPLPTGSNVIGAVTQSAGPWTENLTQIAGNAVSTAATGVQKVGIVGNTGTAFESTAGVLDHNLKNVANNAVATAATGVQKVGVVGGTGTSFETTAGVMDHNLKNVGNSAVATLGAGEQKVAVEGLAAAGSAPSGNPIQLGVVAPNGNMIAAIGGTAGAQGVDIMASEFIVQTNATVTTSGSSLVTKSFYGVQQINLIINVTGSITGTTPTLSYTIQEVDPGNGTTTFGNSATSATISVAGVYTATLTATTSSAVKVSWTVTGTTPSFGGVYATVVSKATPTTQAISSSPSNTTPGIALGNITTTSKTNVAIQASVYTEQSANFTGSIKSASASDASAGTGARSVIIYYLDSTGTTSTTETVTLNGTTAVNLVNTNHCFIEKMVVASVGSGGSNAGAITLFTGAAGAGTAVAIINAGDNQTYLGHHYVVNGKTSHITDFTGTTNSSNETLFSIQSTAIPVANIPGIQISDWVTGSQTNQTQRTFGSNITVTGPARLQLFGAPGSTSSMTSYGSFTFFDQ